MELELDAEPLFSSLEVGSVQKGITFGKGRFCASLPGMAEPFPGKNCKLHAYVPFSPGLG